MLGCGGQALPPQQLPELVAGSAYDEHVASLRATLVRNHIALDTAPVVTTCTTHHDVSDCVRCEVASREDTRGIDPDLIDEVAIAFAHYPTSVLSAAKLEHGLVVGGERDDECTPFHLFMTLTPRQYEVASQEL